MRRQIIVMFCSLFCFVLALATPPATAAVRSTSAAAVPRAATPNRGALFKVTGGGHILYLFGTIHVGTADFFPLEPRVSKALERAGALALEIDPLGNQPGMAHAMQQYGLYAPGAGSALADIAPQFRPSLERLLKQYSIEPAAVASMKPWVLATMLAVGEFAMAGYTPDQAVDSYLSRQAHERQIPVLELESAAGQMALFDRMPRPDQVRFLEESITAIEGKKEARQARDIAQAWGRADAAALDALAQEAAQDTTFTGRFTQQVLLRERNPGLADGIARLLKQEKDSLAAIGVLHLIGKDSVPDLLRRRGLKVERVY